MRRIITCLLLVVATAVQAAPRDTAEIQLALRKLTVVGSAMYIAAHPDDDNASVIAFLAKDRLLRTAYLSCTRGDGGQNLIGDEKGELLGVLRTQELLDSRRVDGGEQFFTRALDFGFSKGPDETLAIWGHDTILGDMVWNIRRFQPDIMITRFPTTGEGGHGHHTASAILAGEAFLAAGDPAKYPDQLKFVNVWQPRRLFWNKFNFRPTDPNDPSLAKSLRLDVGTYNTTLGRSYTEIAGESRTQNKSQGTGAPERKGTAINYFDLLAGDPATKDIMEGIDTSWSRYEGGAAVGSILQEAADKFDPKDPSKSLPLLLNAYDALQKLGASQGWSPRNNPWIPVKLRDLLDAIQMCAGLAIDVSAGDSSVIREGEVPVSVTVVNRSDYPFTLTMVAGKYANPGKGVNIPLKNNQPAKVDISVKIPSYTDISQPYWLTKPEEKGRYTVENPQLIGLAENPAAIPIVVTLSDDKFHNLIFTTPAVYRWVDPVRGEQTRSLDIVPDATANLGSHVYVFPDTQPKPVTVWLTNFGPATSAKLKLNVPEGWKTDPAEVPLVFSKKGDEAHATFNVTPTAAEGSGVISAEVALPTGAKWALGLTTIDYPHISPQRVFGDAAAKAVRVNVKKRGSRVGYIMGSGDDVAEALRQIGYDVSLLTDADLERGDFAKYDAIVAGVRAYNTRKRMKLVHPKLLEYVKNGGTYIVQYNTLQELQVDGPGPYPFKVTNERVTVEEAPMKLVHPEHILLNAPNKITEADFSGWVQERGLNFTQNWDPKYETIFASNDPGEPSKEGGELFARYGKGVFIYSSYAWFRQLPAGVPGAYKLFANMVSAK